MPPLTNVQELQHLLRMINFMQPFVPHVSHHTVPPGELLGKLHIQRVKAVNQSFQWPKPLMVSAFQKLFSYFNHSNTISVQVNVSNSSLIASLLQEGQPITFMAKSEAQYMNKNGELWTVVSSYTRFHMYLYDQTFTVESPHKPLEMIIMKNLILTLL